MTILPLTPAEIAELRTNPRPVPSERAIASIDERDEQLAKVRDLIGRSISNFNAAAQSATARNAEAWRRKAFDLLNQAQRMAESRRPS